MAEGKIKAVALLSGGLDSALTIKLALDMGLDVVALRFTSPFYQDGSGADHAEQVARNIGVELVNMPKGEDFLDIVRHPKRGRGAGMNPCIDCRAYMLRRAKEFMEQIGASFLITGEVIGQRPMSQYRKAMDIVEADAGVAGILLRPLCGKLLPPTIPEEKGWIRRDDLLAFEGRTRRPQIELAARLGVQGFSPPAGGCLLCEKVFAARLRDMLRHEPGAAMRDIGILKIGRHYRVGADRVVSGRDRMECKALRSWARPGDWFFDPVSGKGALVLLKRGAETGGEADGGGGEAFDFALRLASAYCDGDSAQVTVQAHQKNGETLERTIPRAARDDFKNWKI